MKPAEWSMIRFGLAVCLFASLAIGGPSSIDAQAPAQPRPEGDRGGAKDPVQSILNGLQQRAEKQRQSDQRDAAILLRNAQEAHRAGDLSEAVKLARQAERLFPESPEIRSFLRSVRRQQEDQRTRSVMLGVVARRMEEALERVEALRQEGRNDLADELADAVRETLAELPESPQLAEARKLARQVLGGGGAGGLPQDPGKVPEPIEKDEDIPPPVRIDPPPPTDSRESAPLKSKASESVQPPITWTDAEIRKALKQRISIYWVQLPLTTALQELSRAGGVPIVLDSSLVRAGFAPTVLVNLHAPETTIERVLRSLGELTGGAYILSGGQVIFTTKRRALEFVIAGQLGNLEAALPSVSPAGERYESSLGAPIRSEPTVPEYLRSAKAFRDHIQELLRP